jgi:hypothetical protein
MDRVVTRCERAVFTNTRRRDEDDDDDDDGEHG